MRMIRDLARRRLRTSLTIAGIAIGIWALVVFSSMANKINTMVAGDSRYHADKIVITDGAIALGDAPMRVDLADELRVIDGVDVVTPSVTMLAGQLGGVVLGPPDQIVGSPVGADAGRETVAALTPASGRLLTVADEGDAVTVVGADVAAKRHLAVGDSVELHGRSFEVVGILSPTLSVPDRTFVVPFATAQGLLHASLPPVVRDGVAAADIVSQFIVYPAAGADHQVIADAIEAQLPDVSAMTGEGYDRTYLSSAGAFNSIIVGIGVISLIVGGMSIINTMAMSVAERTREIGIKRAIGAGRRRVVRELMTEAGVIGTIGGLVGAALGALVVLLVNEMTRSSGTILFELTPATLALAVAFSTILGVIAGIIPAWSAARLDPVAALRYE
jgi:putative ABC transport system permease protein